MKVKAILIKDFFNDKGALRVGDKVIVDETLNNGWSRVISDTGSVFIIPSHIIKNIPW